MCKHILNAQVSVRAPCCQRWFDCPQCHEEQADHPLARSWELTLVCKHCRRCFRVDPRDGEADEADEHCPHCDNHYVLPAKLPQRKVVLELEGPPEMLRDPRVRQRHAPAS
eukprot:TRINITY_DN4330_c0_g2_i2.p1 TRINITY_DN4330_c0_g2~~TRINITY_DN4330_c0_g2_i2.p1  ORF type:complete len:111 (-),score=35.23 TRINITY_DN4330_c0_g2_i2:196-528(-)